MNLQNFSHDERICNFQNYYSEPRRHYDVVLWGALDYSIFQRSITGRRNDDGFNRFFCIHSYGHLDDLDGAQE